MTSKTESIEVEVVYIGRRLSKTGSALAFVTQAQIVESLEHYEARQPPKFPSMITERLDGEASLFRMKRAPSTIGGVYRCKGIIEGGRIVSLSTNFIWAGKTVETGSDLVPAWKAADDRVFQEQRMSTLEKRADADPAFTRAVDLLRDRYQKVAAGNRRSFQLWLLDQIEKRK